MQRKLIVFELNEVPFKVMDAFVGRHPNSSFARLMKSAAQFEAYTPDVIHLHPRISWPTFHRGVPDTVHGILHFNKDTSEIDTKYPRYWDLLRRRGKTVGIGASIGSFPVPSDRENISFYLPDMFAPTADTPSELLERFSSVQCQDGLEFVQSRKEGNRRTQSPGPPPQRATDGAAISHAPFDREAVGQGTPQQGADRAPAHVSGRAHFRRCLPSD